MKTNLLYALLALFLFSACSKDESSGPEPEKTHLLRLKKSEISLTDGSKMSMEWNYTYSREYRLERIDLVTKTGTETTNFGTVISHTERGDLWRVINESGRTWSINYNAKNHPVQIVEKNREGASHTYVNDINDLGKALEQSLYAGMISEENLVSTTRISYDKADQITLRRLVTSGKKLEEATVKTDDKHRPVPLLLDQVTPAFQPYGFLDESLYTDHNVISFEDSDNAEEDRSFTASYTYNEAGYPLTCTKTFKTGAVEKTTYTYFQAVIK